MSDQAQIQLTVLWAQELMIASAAVHAAIDAMAEKPLDEPKMQNAVKEAIRAAYVALHGIATNPSAHMVVCYGDRAEFVPRQITVAPPPRGEKEGR